MFAHAGGYAPTVVNGRARLREGWRLKRQRAFYRLVLIDDGVHTLELDGQSVTCGTGGIYMVLPGQGLAGVASPGAKAMLISFTVMACPLGQREEDSHSEVLHPPDDHLQPDPESIWGIRIPTCLSPTLCKRIAPMLRAISVTWWMGARQHYQANRRLAQALDVMYDHYSDSCVDGRGREWPQWLESVIPDIEDLLPSLHTVADLTALTGVSATHLHREFSRVVGETPGVYLRRRRLERAADLLRETDLSVAGIAELVGYSSQSAFNNAWRRVYDVAPLSWRRIQQ